MGYTKKELLEECDKAFKNINSFYKRSFINYRGRTIDTKEYYTEVVSEYLCDVITEYINGIDCITRNASYKVIGHDGNFNPDSNRMEEIIAMRMYKYCADDRQFDFIGKVIDYQTPLKSAKTDEAGKIDLLAYDGQKLRLLELKKSDSKESMLRCILEGFTYLRTAGKSKLLEDFGLPADTELAACPFVFRGGEQWQEMQKERPQLQRLMKLLNSKPYYIVDNDGIYRITEE